MEHTNELNIGKLNTYEQNNMLNYEGSVLKHLDIQTTIIIRQSSTRI